jgi:hypothetical protein
MGTDSTVPALAATLDLSQARPACGDHNGRMKRLLAMLRRRGATLPARPDADALQAIKRCEACRHAALCDELLASPGSGGNRSFCPNAPYVEQRREKELTF